ncbi:flagellar biosynthetic protein FliO [Mesobacillus maritimus]|uniref:flagellar biosynthetic protein FliO n=1 Tax=Mesobacillus maritimus TaxID=1643336 RepID=UPI003850A505
MIRKAVIVGFAICWFLFVGSSISVEAEEPNVLDWLNEEQLDGQPVETDPISNSERNDGKAKSPILLIGQLLFYTLLIVVMIYALIKFLASRQKKLQPNQAIQLIGGTALGNNKSLQLVKVGGNVYLLGVADQITLIKEFSNEEELGSFDAEQKKPVFFSSSIFGSAKQPANQSPGQGFEQLFQTSLKKQKEKQHQVEHDLFENDREGRDR